ncbi:hypothetical protein B0O80DRAFT_526712 [Mortierella sp. GBAus27b]|nr:hypothetical protein B0O80DRAFT_526712 [Mortierella sp. GBAus27b]
MDSSMLSYENSSRGKLHDSIFDIMRHPLTHSIAIRGIPEDFIRQSSLLKKNDGFPSLRHMEIDLTELKEDIPGIKCLISNAPDLSSLIFQDEIDDSSLLRLYMAIAEHQTCSITFVPGQIRNMRAKGITLRGSNNSNSSNSVDPEWKSQLLDRSQFFTDNSSHL